MGRPDLGDGRIEAKIAVASERLLGLVSKLYLSNMPRMLNKDLAR